MESTITVFIEDGEDWTQERSDEFRRIADEQGIAAACQNDDEQYGTHDVVEGEVTYVHL